MIPKLHHFPLRGSREFFRDARSVHTRKLSLFWLPGTEAQSRAAIIVKKTTAPLATQRTAIKRKMRTVILPTLVTMKTPKDFVFIYKGKPAVTSQELTTYVSEILALIRD